jgi:hypothetical protein
MVRIDLFSSALPFKYLQCIEVAKNLQSIAQQHISQSRDKQQEEKRNRTRQVASVKKRSNRINDNDY